MAKIEKMLITGIRSYAPDDRSVIEFQTPLTLIVGPNGTGKTSIIESLKYITTGDLPPGTKGGAFVHDPKIANEKEVKGQVKLRFTDITGNRIDCSRSMVSIQKAKKIESKSLESVIRKTTPEGKVESISSRCTDFSREMISRLGVSKSVLDNVIFCHQEDSAWPLSEGKVLKQKFDAIFAATRYIQALESIRNIRKQQATDIKLYSSDLKHLEQKRDKAAQISDDLSKAEAQSLSAKDQIKKNTDALSPIEDQLRDLDKVSSEIFKIEKDIGNLQTKRDQLKKNITNLDDNIENKFEGSYSELVQLKSEFSEKLEREENNLQDLETSLRRLKIELDRLEENKTSLVKENGRLLQEEQVHCEKLKDRDNLIKAMAGEFAIKGFDRSSFSTSEADGFLDAVKSLFTSLVNKGKATRDSFNKQIDVADSKIKQLEKSLHGIQGGMEQKRNVLNENNRKLDEIKATLSSLAASENRLQKIEVEFTNATEDLENIKRDLDVDQINNEINKLRESKENAVMLLSKLRQEETLLIQHSKSQTRIDMLEKDKLEKNGNIESVMSRHEDMLENLLGHKPSPDELKSDVTQYLRKKQTEVKKVSNEYEMMKTDVTKKESQRKILRKQLQAKEEKLARDKQQLEEICSSEDYNDFREENQRNVEKYQGALIEIGAFEKIFDKYVSQLSDKSSQDKGCPLCRRKFATQREIRNLIEELNQKMRSVPEKREQHQQSLDKELELQEKIQLLSPIKAHLDSLSEELPSLKKNVESLCNEIDGEKEKLEELRMRKTSLEDDERNIRSIEADVSRVDDWFYDIKDIERQLETEQSKLHGIKPGRTLTTVRREVEEKQNVVDGIDRRIDQKRQRANEHEKRINDQEKAVTELKNQKLDLERELQRRVQLENDKKSLMSDVQKYERELREAQKKIAPITADLETANEEKKEIEMTKEGSEQETRNQLEKVKMRGEKLREIINLINKYIKDGKESALDENKENLRILEDRLSKKKRDRETKKQEASRIQEEKVKQDIRMREIDDNLTLLKTKREVESINKDITKLQTELEKFGHCGELADERNSLQEKLDRLRKDRATMEGRLKGFQDEIKRCNNELNSEMFAHAEEKHCNKLIELRTTELAGQDLEKYYKALDRAIMRYHSLKLDEINKIVKEYWMRTYMGNDIDTIEIVSEHDDEGSGASKARRNYNYRVCMVKKGLSLDMRGRCSAGQKVLASIIIRLALAETFCLNCGILALDEPTTNLDEENIKSLANSLRGVIEMRMQQKNFQLLIITHDEDFVRALGSGADYVDYYFSVYKDDDGNSKIHKKRMELRE